MIAGLSGFSDIERGISLSNLRANIIMTNAKGGASKQSETLIKLALLIVGTLAVITLFLEGDKESEQPEGLVQILAYTLHHEFDGEPDENRDWRVEFVLPPELQRSGQGICETYVSGKQYLALTTIEPHSQNGTTRYAPAWIREDLHAATSGRYLCDLNVNGANIPWQIPKAELDEINFRNRNRAPL